MSTNGTIEQRVAVLEATVAELQRRLSALSPTDNWLDKVTGSFKDQPAFDEVLAYGRAERSKM